MATRRNSEFVHISWMTISYRSVFAVLVVILLGVGITLCFLFPNSPAVQTIGHYGNVLTEKIGLNAGGKRIAIGPQEAHFTALDGTVKVKKADKNTWVNADFGLPLEKGDIVQTSPEGMAKVFFPDGTSYTVKPDSLIVIEENSANEQLQTKVAVQVTTGTVDLSTSTYTQGSSSQVIMEGSQTNVAPDTEAMVRNDPGADTHEIVVKKGSATVTRNSETVTLTEYEKVAFRSEAPQMSRTKEIVPPALVSPGNLAAVPVSKAGRSVHFSWTSTADSRAYRLRVSPNPFFSSTVFDKVVQSTDVDVPHLPDGSYYWVVTALDRNGHESEESDRNQFTVVERDSAALVVPLELEPFVQHGHVIEVKGKTDPGSRVMVNGQEVPVVRSDGGFSFFTAPLPNGENMITVTARNANGGVKTEQKRVVIE